MGPTACDAKKSVSVRTEAPATRLTAPARVRTAGKASTATRGSAMTPQPTGQTAASCAAAIQPTQTCEYSNMCKGLALLIFYIFLIWTKITTFGILQLCETKLLIWP